MRRKGKSQKGTGHVQPKTISGPSGKRLKRCKNYGKADNIVLIDIDDDDTVDNEITSSVPESLNQNLKDPSILRNDRCQIPVIIFIDEDDDISDQNQPGTSVEGADSSDASSSSRFPPSNQTGNSPEEDGDECQFLHEVSPLKLSKCKRTYCAKVPSRNRYGLGPDLDGDLDGEQSDKDQLDSEYMEDTLGELQALWENANKIRKTGVQSAESVKTGQSTTSSTQQKEEVVKEKKTGKLSKGPAHLSPGKVSSKGSTTSDIAGIGKSRYNSTFHKKTPFGDVDLKSAQETKVSESNAEQTVEKAKDSNTMFFREGAYCSFGPSSSSFTKNATKQTNNISRFSEDKENTHFTEYFSRNGASIGVKFGNNDGASYASAEASVFRTQHSVDVDIGNGVPSCSYNLHGKLRSSCSNSANKENIVCGEPLFWNSKPTGETRVSDELVENDAETVRGEYAGKDPTWGMPNLGETEDRGHDIATEPKRAGQQEDEGQLDDQANGGMDAVQDCLINNREKLKETDEYKRAVEKEWASRQEALQLQAEEAQKMRLMLKRKKAESLRLLDMERRQKQRVEEIRNTQKKDEENMNMKEKIRAEVRVELKQLEMKSLDMGSLLRGLGVHVSGGLQPRPHEIHAAYKKALLSFHPDRAPASDIRKLVEAEEKFKLISRMKEKFLPVS